MPEYAHEDSICSG